MTYKIWLDPVCPDWTNLKGLGDKFSDKCRTIFLVVFLAILKKFPIKEKTDAPTFCAIGLLFIPLSGHTGWIRNRGRPLYKATALPTEPQLVALFS